MLPVEDGDHRVEVLPCGLSRAELHNMRVLITFELVSLCELWVLVSEQLTDSLEEVIVLVCLMPLSHKQVHLLALLNFCLFRISFLRDNIYIKCY